MFGLFLLHKMACGRRIQEFSIKLGYRLSLIDRYCVAQNFITSRNIYLSACHCKTPSSYTKNSDLDFYGLNDSNSDSIENYQENSKTERKFINDLIEKHTKEAHPEKVVLKSFGAIRYDKKVPLAENTQPTERQTRKKSCRNAKKEQNSTDGSPSSYKFHSDVEFSNYTPGNSEADNVSKNVLEQEDSHLSFVDEQYFSYEGELKEKNEFQNNTHQQSEQSLAKTAGEPSTMNEALSYDKTESKEQDIPFIDEQYFNYNGMFQDKTSTVNSNTINTFDSHAKSKEYGQNNPKPIAETKLSLDKSERFRQEAFKGTERNLSFNDDQFFDYHSQIAETKLEKEIEHSLEFEHEMQPKVSRRRNNKSHEKEMNVTNVKPRKTEDRTEEKLKFYKQQDHVSEDTLYQKEQTAYEASMEVRAKLEDKKAINLVGAFDPKQYDSKGFRILRNQVPHFENAPSIDVVKVLRKGIIYDNHDILAISKPYGLPSTGGPGVFHSVESLLDQLVPKTQLFPVHRLDKETTGVMLFAKTEEMADRLNEAFLKQEVVKKYLVITKNIPEQQTGVIDIPVAEGTVGGKFRMCLRPYYSPELSPVVKKSQGGMKAITKYKVLDKGDKCALLECYPVTGKKHQIRVHLAFGINCPILGDHKYSHIEKLAPMRLHPEILRRLKIQQSKVRYLAMHLHARSITIPEFLNGRNLFILAPLPPHFVRNMKDLKMKLPSHS